MKLEIGRKYRNRAGKVVTLAKPKNSEDIKLGYLVDDDGTFFDPVEPTGHLALGGLLPDPRDLMEEIDARD